MCGMLLSICHDWLCRLFSYTKSFFRCWKCKIDALLVRFCDAFSKFITIMINGCNLVYPFIRTPFSPGHSSFWPLCYLNPNFISNLPVLALYYLFSVNVPLRPIMVLPETASKPSKWVFKKQVCATKGELPLYLVDFGCLRKRYCCWVIQNIRTHNVKGSDGRGSFVEGIDLWPDMYLSLLPRYRFYCRVYEIWNSPNACQVPAGIGYYWGERMASWTGNRLSADHTPG